MRAEELLRAGDLDGALQELQAEVRKRASDAKLRIFLFQLLSVRGDWTRAIAQLKLSAEMEPSAVPMAQTYREAIICEVFREKVFAGEKVPLIFGEPQEWAALMVEATKVLAQGHPEEAARLRERAFEAAPAARGEINGMPFDWIADADMRLGPLLEVIVNGRYFWMPFTAIGSMIVEPPKDLRDCVWMPATMTLRNGGDVVALIPTRYAGTVALGDDAAKLARATEFRDAGAETFLGVGQRLLATDAGDTPLMELRTLTIHQDDGGEAGADG
ncbi:type VI secretion system accessory protein TagJ [Albidovulum sediminicola]|uniref:Virulence protein SciE type n=1 Tax=Albidovulum sediminicola TaxID=2984331 RepID=A0ABT2Z0G0_9RHOB|nr:type VI secretion system accessory protein TagJ [Defluviimonas sp. WL0075]MCV2864502.1 virulence protein SciE type [Defluviimonas sp. WL0075]